ncbi:MAG TPA: hypothetical protein DEF47_16260 [Herpetosiphon sp.]|uniref:Uncharacterized protein n=1 Tax=Herpetosiphon aurantiacus (strain ATCC 23779 / DSM 785 / 114-95) TaxID=316274 RepID=A9AZ94_HERA2|nr:hypothetical protein [Herpetosiphon sp.]ABX03640.1 hypothetical protein Haur_0992 [Herpetosiphon aurantiacus DSM 785]HBW51449.1 hypothetical protein [Herpetosiphon sp.]
MQQIQQVKYGKKPLGIMLIGFIFAARATFAGGMMLIFVLRFLDLQPGYLLPYGFMVLVSGAFTFLHIKIVQGLFGFREKMRNLAVILELIIVVLYWSSRFLFDYEPELAQTISIIISMVIIWYLSRDKTRAWFAPNK